MADDRTPIRPEEVAQMFAGLSEQTRERLVTALAQYLLEREQEKELLGRLRDLK